VPGHSKAQTGDPDGHSKSARDGRAGGRSRKDDADGSRRLGQHFLGSRRLAARLVADAGVGRAHRVVDLGAGAGALTAALVATGASVLAVELDDELARGLAVRFADVPTVIVLCADVCDVPLPVTPYRVVANPPFAHTAAVLRRLLDAAAGGLERADLVVQWQVARHRARVDAGAPADLLGATWGPWWRFARGRRLPAASFRPAPSVDAAVLVVTRRDPPLLPAAQFAAYAGFVRSELARRSDQRAPVEEWVARFSAGRVDAGLHSRRASANMD
jgi:23S rRNA (adenine-N6)-dimethyltransferase